MNNQELTNFIVEHESCFRITKTASAKAYRKKCQL